MNRKERRLAVKAGRSVSPGGAGAGLPLLALANARYQAGKLDEADGLCIRVLSGEPRSAPAHYLRGMIASQQGRHEMAIGHLKDAIAIAPQVPAAHHALAEAYRLGHRPVDAERHYRMVAELQPSAATYLNLGNAIMTLGRSADAASVYQAALSYDASLPELYLALGRAYSVLKQREAIDAFSHAVRLRPGSAEANEGLLDACLVAGASVPVLRLACEALRRVDTPKLRRHFIDVVSTATPTEDLPELREAMQRALAECWARPHDLTRVACAIIAVRDPIDERHPLLRTLLEVAPICHARIERTLAKRRRALLDLVAAETALSAEELAFACTLARQCHINEYVWHVEPAEITLADALRQQIETDMEQGSDPNNSALAVVAMYLPLAQLRGADALVTGRRPSCVAAVLEQQIVEPAEETRIRGTIIGLTTIGDAISQAVREQYEANPYPRWVTMPRVGSPMPLSEWLAARFPDALNTPLPSHKPLDVLVAGCGTGQQPIETLLHLADVRVLAIDLSLASLAYAVRMTERMGMKGITYAQADLLEARQLGQSFDMIEAGGVLHHLSNLWTGWRVLLSLLRPGGVMSVGLYTVRGRNSIRPARDWIATHGYSATVEGIRGCRQAIRALPHEWATTLSTAPDFQTMSTCRDLLFHVQEHAISLPEVSEFLLNEGITLLGLNTSVATERNFKAWCGASNLTGVGDLARWDLYEEEHPACFAGMVNLWVQKPLTDHV